MAVKNKENKLIVSVSPHVRDGESVGRIMWSVNLALLPAFIMAVYYFGPRAVYVTGLSILAAVLTEHFFQKGIGRPSTIHDGSAVLTGLLLGLNLPASVPFYIPIAGSFFVITIVKMLFGGLGYNVFNPALMGRAFLLITWPKAMTIWYEPTAKFVGMDATTTATPLGVLKEEGLPKLIQMFGDKSDMYLGMLSGNTAGSLGETSALALLVGALFLMARRYITWHIPVSFLGTVALFAWVFGGEGFFNGDPLIHVLSGGLFLGAFFMATDYVTCPTVRKGQIIFGIGCGAITMLIRLWGGFPEGVMFAVLLMNCFAPLIDRSVKPELFGAVKEQKQ
ncbi:MAG: RnfABCDGE type electron transport complex subunit D [Nitrospira sp.]|nr:RnfABCDGE type electron transport complex subunit D [Nitrospira sp.]